MEYILPKKEWYMLQYGWTLKTWGQMKEASHRRPLTVWPLLGELSKIGQAIETESGLVVA